MPLLKKILLLFIILNSLFLILGSPPPSFAEAQNACKTQGDCASSQYGTFCKCEHGFDENDHCLPNPNVADTRGGYCTTGVQCDPNKYGYGCGNDESCVSYNGGFWCLPDKNATPDLAAPAYYIRTPEDIINSANDVDGPYDSDKFKIETMTGLASTMIVALGGGESNVLGSSTQSNSGATGILTGLVLNMTTKPIISSKEYLADLGQNLGLVPISPAYAQAQGIGFNAFLPVLPLWKTFRDIAYLAFVAVFLFVGLMIMFRKKIDPRTVVTIQESLPKIIVSLILVTFSYAIAGLVVDLSQFATRLIGTTLYTKNLIATIPGDSSVSGKAEGKIILEELFNDNIFKLVNPLRNVDDLVKGIGEIEAAPTDKIPLVPSWLAQITVRAIFWFAGFFVMFKIFFALLTPFVSIMLSVIFAPIQLLLGALPGNNDALQGWLKGLIANVAVFPATFTMLAISAILHDGVLSRTCASPQNALGIGPSSRWCPAEQTYGTFLNFPALGNWGAVAGQLISFGILFTIPKVAEMIQAAFQMKPGPGSSAFREEIAAGAGRVPVVGGLVGGFLK